MKYAPLSFLVMMTSFPVVPAATAQTSRTATQELQVVEAKLCRAIRNRVVEDEDSSFARDSKVFLWIRTSGGMNGSISVSWKNGSYVHETSLPIGGSPWRTWASKIVRMSGDWEVTISDEKQTVLQEKRFKVR
jgi:hypothetical protein